MKPAFHLLADAGLMVAFGTLLFRAVVLDQAMPRLLMASLVLALAGAVGWLIAQAAAFGGDAMTVLTGTRFGHVLAAQAVLVALAVVVGGRLGTVLAGISLAAAAARGHGAAMEDSGGLMLCAALHLLAAGAWLGSLPALAVALAAGEIAVARRYFRLGIVAVVALVATAGWQGWALGGGLAGLIGTGYGAMLGLKAALLVVLVILAWVNRYRLVPALPEARPMLLGIIGLEIGLGLGALTAAVVLAGMPPGMHAQPWWPFAWRPDGFAFADPDLRREVVGGLTLCVLAVALVVGGWWRRWLWLGVPVALWLGVPHLDLLLVPAYPTSFWQEPDPPTPASIARGEHVYVEHCASCHGAGKQGDGPAGKTLAFPPADLTAEHLWDHSDGELFWWLTAGMAGPDGQPVMPGFAARLDEADRWAVIDAIRATNPYRPAEAAAGHHHH